MNSQAPSFGQRMVDQVPRFDNQVKKKKRKFSSNQVMGKNLIHPDKRHKVKYL